MGPVTLLILDGWGVTAEKRGNSIAHAHTPNYKYLLENYPNSTLDASGVAVGLPPGLMGNSEVGHLTIGAGRSVVQKLTLISNTILDGSFFSNPVLVRAAENVKRTGGALHVFGLLSDGCVHSSPDHLDGLIEFAHRNGIKDLVVHPILDGRDTPPRSARRFLRELTEKLAGKGEIGVICGRYYAMDRDNRWERVEQFWKAIVLGEARPIASAVDAIDDAYRRDEGDEFVKPYIVTNRPIRSGDSAICFNFRPDRVRQISRALTQKDFSFFARITVPDIHYVCLTEYDGSLTLPVAFSHEALPSQDISKTLPELLSCHSLGQFHAAETEKYAHVTYFLNGGREAAVLGEERRMVPSLKVATYDLAPKMQTPEVCEEAVKAIKSGQYPFIVLNFANPDMVGHTGIMEAAIEAVQSVDDAFGKLLEATKEANGSFLITSDHGNVEQMIDYKTGEPHTAHTTSPVPFIVASFQKNDPVGLANGSRLAHGALSDVAPTILELMNLEKPVEMSGTSLIKRG
ncbi:MAG: 2,3-bisphosphoglycerate-independent phosphoglycerate mutase [Candidatus Obscuribacterales bacterium]|nr:2,3-bisphosphoglycerate-independent phosphoglycerate mutase [Candidatus Obscuribacterales bacterium]